MSIMEQRLGTRSTLLTSAGETIVSIQSPKNWWMLVFLPIWLVGWTVGGVVAIRQLVTGEQPPSLIIWVAFWLAAELAVTYAWAWASFGREVVRVQNGNLTVTRMLGARFPHMLVRVDDFTDPRPTGWFGPAFSLSASLRMWGVTGGTIAVDGRGNSTRFGLSLEEEEARTIAAAIVSHHKRSA